MSSPVVDIRMKWVFRMFCRHQRILLRRCRNNDQSLQVNSCDRRRTSTEPTFLNRLCYLATAVLLSFATIALPCWASQGSIDLENGGTTARFLPDIADNTLNKPPLEGEVDDAEVVPKKAAPLVPLVPMAVPVLPKTNQSDGLAGKAEQAKEDEQSTSPMAGKVDKSSLQGQEDMDDDGLKPLTATAAPSGGLLKGGARIEDGGLTGEDPDAQDQELQVEWDRWRNRFLQAVLSGAMDNLNNPQEADLRFDPRTQRVIIQFPLGTIAWFSCQITNDRQIKTLRLDQSSGYENYDRAVLNAVRDLGGTAILQFPRRSRRLVVSQNGGVKTSDHTERQFFRFGDVERYTVPGN